MCIWIYINYTLEAGFNLTRPLYRDNSKEYHPLMNHAYIIQDYKECVCTRKLEVVLL